MSDTNSSWKNVGKVPPGDLIDARVGAHAGLLLAAIMGKTFGEPMVDKSHHALSWGKGGAVALVEKKGEKVTSCLSLEPFSLFIVADAGESFESFPLAGRSVDETLVWVARQASFLGFDANQINCDRSSFPGGLAARGSHIPGRGLESEFSELALYLTNANELLGQVGEELGGKEQVWLWPDSFELALTVPVKETKKGVTSIILGFSPGDLVDPDPFFFVRATPAPPGLTLLPPPAKGAWRTGGWSGAVLPVAKLLELPQTEQESRARTFLKEAYSHFHTLVA